MSRSPRNSIDPDDWQSGFSDGAGVRTHVIGSREPRDRALIGIHGFTDNAQCLLPLFERFSDAYETIAYDVRSHGLSDAPESGYDLLTLAHDLERLITASQISNPILYGYGMGAEIAAVVAARDVVAPVVVLAENPPALRAATSDPEDRHRQVETKFDRWRRTPHDELAHEYGRTPVYASLLATARKQLRPEALAIDQRGYAPLDEILPASHETPTLLLRPDPGQTDYLTTRHDSSIRRARPSVNVQSIDGGIGTLHRRAPSKTVSAMISFLRDHVSTAPGRL